MNTLARQLRRVLLVSLVASSALLSSPAESAPTVSAPVKARFAKTKKRADPAKINNVFSVVNGKPTMRTKSGKTVPLDPAALLDVGPANPPAELSKYQPYYGAVSDNPLAEQVTAVPIRVDHSARQTPVKDQRSRGSCVAFGIISGMESYLKWKSNLEVDISEEHMFKLFKDSVGKDCNAYGFSFGPAKDILATKKVCGEAQLPYADPSACTIPAACSNAAVFSLDRSLIIPKEPASAGSTYFSGNTKVLEAFLDMGYDISIALDVAGTGWNEDADSGIIDVQTDPDGTPADSRGGHVLSIVGYDRPGGYFLIKNSWGTDWGRAGYGRFSYDYMQTYKRGGLVVLEASRKLVVQSTTPQLGTAR